MPKLEIEHSKCQGCGLCVCICASEGLELIDFKSTLREQNCTCCGLCESVCPRNAISCQLNVVLAERSALP